jgi:hypothetical protein
MPSSILPCFKKTPPDEGRKRVLGIMAAILASMHMQTADDLFGGPQGSPRSDKLIAASVQWAEKIMAKIDERSARRLK